MQQDKDVHSSSTGPDALDETMQDGTGKNFSLCSFVFEPVLNLIFANSFRSIHE